MDYFFTKDQLPNLDEYVMLWHDYVWKVGCLIKISGGKIWHIDGLNLPFMSGRCPLIEKWKPIAETNNL